MDERLRNALVSHDVKFIDELLNPSDETLHPPVIDYKVLSDQMHEFKWHLEQVVDIGEADLTRHFLRAGNGSVNVDEGLHEAVYNFDADHVRLFLQEFNADPNSFDEDLRTPIYHLFPDDYELPTADDDRTLNADDAVEIIKMLIEKGAKMVTPRDGYNDLQVRYTLNNGTSEAVSIILDMDVIDLKERYKHGCTVAHYLATNRNPNTLTLLQNRDFHVDSRDRMERTPLWLAASCGIAHAVEFLLKKGADMNIIVSVINSTPFEMATRSNQICKTDRMESILLFLEHGVDVQAQHSPYDDVPPTTVFHELRRPRVDQRPSKVILQHLALQAAMGTTIIECVQNTINSDPVLKKELDSSRQLLQNKIYGSRTLLSVLTCGEEKLVSWMRNEQLAKILQSHSDHLKSINSIYYNRMLQKRLTKAVEIVELRRKAAFVIGKLMKMDRNRQPVVVDIVLRYLDLADLNTLLSLSV